MTRAVDLLREAFAILRREREIVIAIAAPFLFLPPLALQLLIAPPPALPEARDQETMARWFDALMAWGQPAAPWYLAADAIGLYGMVALALMFVAEPRPTVAQALRRALVLLPRTLLAGLLIAIPVGLGLWLILPGLFAQARLSAALPIVARGRDSAAASLARSWRLTRPLGFAAFGAMVLLFSLQWFATAPLALLDAMLREPARENPFVLALVDAGMAALAAAYHGAVLLVGLVLYRRSASRGI